MITPYENSITADGTYSISAPFIGSDYILYVSGNFGGGEVTIGFIDAEDEFASFKNANNEDTVCTSSNGYILAAPPSKLLAVDVDGSSNASITLTLNHRKV